MNRNRRLDVLDAIKQIPERRRVCVPIVHLETRTGLSDKAIRNHLRSLASDGIIALQRPYPGVPYSINILKEPA